MQRLLSIGFKYPARRKLIINQLNFIKPKQCKRSFSSNKEEKSWANEIRDINYMDAYTLIPITIFLALAYGIIQANYKPMSKNKKLLMLHYKRYQDKLRKNSITIDIFDDLNQDPIKINDDITFQYISKHIYDEIETNAIEKEYCKVTIERGDLGMVLKHDILDKSLYIIDFPSLLVPQVPIPSKILTVQNIKVSEIETKHELFEILKERPLTLTFSKSLIDSEWQ